jgi:predicted ribosome quality control (RQC) complex YloA/Tae2 family protein
VKKNKEVAARNGNVLVTGFVTAFFDIVKHFISDLDNRQKVRKIDKYQEGLQNVEHLIIRLEDKLEQNRREIEDLKNRLMWGNIIIIILLLTCLYHLLLS